MNTFFPSESDKHKPQSVFSYLLRIPQEGLFIIAAICVLTLGIAVFLSTFSGNSDEQATEITWEESKQSETGETEPNISPREIFVDVSGSVSRPGMYKLSSTSRLTTAVEKAGGLTDDADFAYYFRNFNLAKTLEDQEKIYIPSRIEIQSGIFTENARQLQYLADQQEEVNSDMSQEEDQSKININTATNTELETLPGVGEVTAGKIINNRPYESIDDLRTKNVVGEATFNKIQKQITN